MKSIYIILGIGLVTKAVFGDGDKFSKFLTMASGICFLLAVEL